MFCSIVGVLYLHDILVFIIVDGNKNKWLVEEGASLKKTGTNWAVWLNTAKDLKGPQRTHQRPTKDPQMRYEMLF